jgi:Aldo/keto reductase family
MEYRPLGRTGIRVSKLCLGTMMFGAWGNPDHTDTIRIIHRALDAGINFVGTADVYSAGESEDIVGEASKGRRDDVVLATKFWGAMGDDPNRRGSRAAGSLPSRELGVRVGAMHLVEVDPVGAEASRHIRKRPALPTGRSNAPPPEECMRASDDAPCACPPRRRQNGVCRTCLIVVSAPRARAGAKGVGAPLRDPPQPFDSFATQVVARAPLT